MRILILFVAITSIYSQACDDEKIRCDVGCKKDGMFSGYEMSREACGCVSRILKKDLFAPGVPKLLMDHASDD
jgi:hypothetical protein